MARDRSNRVIALVTVCVFSAALIPQSSSAGGGGGGGAVSPSASIVGDSSSVSNICTLCSAETQLPCINQATSLHCPHSSSHLPSDSTQRAYSTSFFSPGPSDACNAHPHSWCCLAPRDDLDVNAHAPPPSLFPRPSARQHCKPAHVNLGRHLACLHWPYLSC